MPADLNDAHFGLETTLSKPSPPRPRPTWATVPTMSDEAGGKGNRARIVRAARGVLADRGLDTTVDDVALAAGMSRRTVFRHFATRDALLAEAVRDGIRSYGDHLVPANDGDDLDAWLLDAMVTVHRLNARHGRIYWELAGLGRALEGDIAVVAEERRTGRRALVRSFTDAVWRSAGGDGRPPAWLADVCAVHLSAFTTRALTGDFGRSPDEIGRVCARAVAAAARDAVAQRA
jgi:AcrR family transcriptional regulator